MNYSRLVKQIPAQKDGDVIKSSQYKYSNNSALMGNITNYSDAAKIFSNEDMYIPKFKSMYLATPPKPIKPDYKYVTTEVDGTKINMDEIEPFLSESEKLILQVWLNYFQKYGYSIQCTFKNAVFLGQELINQLSKKNTSIFGDIHAQKNTFTSFEIKDLGDKVHQLGSQLFYLFHTGFDGQSIVLKLQSYFDDVYNTAKRILKSNYQFAAQEGMMQSYYYNKTAQQSDARMNYFLNSSYKVKPEKDNVIGMFSKTIYANAEQINQQNY